MRSESIGLQSTYKTVWWYVNLGDVYSVYSIRILFKTYQKQYENRQRGRFAGFSLYLSNTVNKDEGHLCYKDGPQLPPLEFTTTCIGYGTYVIFYNERLDGTVYPTGYEKLIITELCEVVVEGCKRGTYGKLCNNNCSKHCEDNKCDITNGTCLGCLPGWKGQFCQTQCDSGSYGKNCNFRCSGHCLDDQTCNHLTGICDKGCVPGWTLTMCNESCSYGRYGPNCAFNCSGHCLNGNTCNKETGHCDSGCTPGYIGIFCNKVCSNGWFGEGCRYRCSGHCANYEHCNHVDGICPNGCQNGYLGNICNKSCVKGFFGANCSKNCSQNCKEICNHIVGSCLCKSGWMDSPICSTECPPHTYGENCIHSCSANCANGTCDKFNGSCTEGCRESYYGDICDQSDGSFLLNMNSKSAKPPIVGGVLGAIAFVTILIALTISLLRKGIFRSWIERRRHSQIYINSTDTLRQPNDESHTYQTLNDSNKPENYMNFDLHEPEDTAACAYQGLRISKNEGNYVNLELDKLEKERCYSVLKH
ncbi:multiple epidermal growth factor-like domains protein 10 [Saccostrea cucullata]|uniref:multiple epidermal growth factor-like domains protein 10 n=1 Tax=Saccostrea cuccullata TaxID=36930 RepID=UPI002ED34C2D